MRSRSAIGRPLTSATAPPVRSNRRLSDLSNASETCTSAGDGPISMIVPSTSSKSAMVFKSSLAKTSMTGSLAIGGTTIIRTLREGSAERSYSARQHLDVAVDAGNDLKFALVDLAFIAGNGAIFALGENHARKGTNRFLDDVTTRRQNRPSRVGERLAAFVADQLERDRRSTVGHRDVGELAGLHANIGTHDGVGIAIIRHDVVSALRHHDDVAGRDMLGNRTAVAGFELAAFVDVERDLAARNAHIADLAFDAQSTGGQFEFLVH